MTFLSSYCYGSYGTTADNGTWPYSDSTTAGTVSPFNVPVQYTSYTVPIQPDPAAVRRHQEQVRRRAWLEKWRAWRQQRDNEIRKREQAEASERARLLLLEYLDEQNRQNLIDKKPLEVMSELHPGVMYQIPNLGDGPCTPNDTRIKAIKNGKVISELCIQVSAPEWLPDEDKLLSKLLHLRNDEAGALRIANHFNVTENLRVVT